MDYTIAIAALKQADPILAGVIDRVGDCTLKADQGSGDLLFALAESIIYQQISGKAAASIHRRFLERLPTPPTATAILNIADEDLRAAGLSRSKVIYVKDLAQKVLDGFPTLADLEGMEDDAIIESLTQVKGIGRWTAQMLLIFRMHRWDVLPADDLGVRSAIRQAYALEALPTWKQVQTLGEPWKPYRTIAAWYLWRSLDVTAIAEEANEKEPKEKGRGRGGAKTAPEK